MTQIKTALLGYGLSGSVFHGPILKCHEGFKIHSIWIRDPAKGAAAQKDFPEAKIHSNLQAVLEDSEINLVIICTPNAQHAELAFQALSAGKHVIVEKPFTITSEEGQKLKALAQSQNLKLGVYQNRRYDGDFLTLQDLIQKGTLGRLTAFESHFDRYRPEFKDSSWKDKVLPGAGILYDLGSHLIDQALCLFGMPQELYADLSRERLGEVDDAFEVLLYYPHFKVTLKASALIKEPTPRFALYGTKGAFVKYGLDPQEEALRSGLLPNTAHWGKDFPKDYGVLNTVASREYIPTLAGCYPSFYQGVYNAIVNNAELPVTSEDGIKVIQLIEAAIESNRIKSRVQL